MTEPTRMGDGKFFIGERPKFCSGVEEFVVEGGKVYWRKRWVVKVPEGYIEKWGEKCRRNPRGHIEFLMPDGKWVGSTSCPNTPLEHNGVVEAHCLDCKNEQAKENQRAKEYRMTNLQQQGQQGRRMAGGR